MISLFFKKRKSTSNTSGNGRKILNRTDNQMSNRVPRRKKK